MNSGSRLE